MDRTLVHLEVLGPRAGADAWLATLQGAGTCHLADALLGFEGEAGIGRARPRDEERRAAELRAPVLLALRGLAGVLPAAVPGTTEVQSWSLPPGGVDEDALAARCEAAWVAALRVRNALEAARDADRAVETLERARAGVRAADAAGVTVLSPSAWAHAGSGAKRLLRRIRRLGAQAGLGVSGAFESIVTTGVVPGQVAPLLAHSDLVPFEFPREVIGETPGAALAKLEPRLSAAHAAAGAAREALSGRLRTEGLECRRALDGLEDAESREEAQRLLASTGHVAAARVYVPSEDLEALLARIERAHGPSVVVRALGSSSDTPGPVRALPTTPFGALRSLGPARFDERAALGTLALVTPFVVAYMAADVLFGALLLLGGLLVGRSAVRGAPRRQAALLARAAGLVGIVAGLCVGRVAGGLGVREFGTGWALAPGVVPTQAGSWFVGLLAAAALLLAAYGLVVVLASGGDAARRAAAHAAHRRCALLGFVAYALAVGGLTPALLAGLYAAALLLLLPPAEMGRLALDVVAGARTWAVGGIALLGVSWSLDALTSDTWVVAALVLPLAAAAIVLDAAAGAMGWSYEGVLGTRGVAQPFTPFARAGSRQGSGDAS